MKKEDINHILQLTQECLNRYWKLDMDYMLGFYGEDSVWIGSEESQFLQGYDDVKKEFYDIKKELKPCHLLNQEMMFDCDDQYPLFDTFIKACSKKIEK